MKRKCLNGCAITNAHPCPAMDGNVFINRGFDLVYKSICRNNPVALFGGCISVLYFII